MQFLKSKLKTLRSDFLYILGLFLFWRILLVIFLLISINTNFLYFNNKYLGGGQQNFPIAPEVFAWANFDGEHYLSIGIFGYKLLEQAFFPVYPFLISVFSSLSTDIFSKFLFSTIGGLFVSNLAFLIAIILLWDLLRIDYSKRVSYGVLITILAFPTSFYFGAVYSESIFLLFIILSFYFARKRNWYLAGFFGMIASATRVFGVLLLPSLLIEAWQSKENPKRLVPLMLIPLGLIGYMIYQWLNFGDPFAFYNLQLVVGEQHQRGVVLFPQVIYRYIKMLLSLDPSNLIYQTIVLEFIVGSLFFLLPFYGLFKRLRLSYLFFAFFGFLIPTVQGSFSSTPRYILVLFPSFIALYLLISKLPKIIQLSLLLASLFALSVESYIFFKGHWVA